jgi:hypothetical protein
MLMKTAPEVDIRLRLQGLYGDFQSLEDELSMAHFGNKAMDKRFAKVTGMFCAAPGKSFPEMSSTPGELAGLYRLFGHPEVTAERIFLPHLAATIERASLLDRVLVPHDTTGVSYGGKGTRQGLGRLNDGGHGYYLHGAIVLTPERWPVPLGVAGYEVNVRTEAPKKPRSWREERDDPDKESRRWARLARQVEERFAGRSTQLIHLMDREADDYELLADLKSNNSSFIIRQKFDRLMALSTEERRSGAPRKVREALSQAEIQVGRYVRLSPRKKDRSGEKQKTHPPREGRLAKLHISALAVKIRRPSELSDKDLPEFIELNVVHVWEVDTPADQHPVEWYLMTTQPIDTTEQILEIVDFYCARWVIEEFWKALKTGCAIEKRQLETSAGLLKVLALSLPMAWQLLLLRSLARSAPDLYATAVLSPVQIEILRKARPRLNLPPTPTIEQALYAVASLGGHLKHNGSPGWKTLGSGFEKLIILEIGWNLAQDRS